MDTVTLTKDGGRKSYDYFTQCFTELYSLVHKAITACAKDIDESETKEENRHFFCVADIANCDHSGICVPAILNIDKSSMTSGIVPFVIDFSKACDSIEHQYELKPYTKSFFRNIDPELPSTAPDAFHVYESDFDPRRSTNNLHSLISDFWAIRETVHLQHWESDSDDDDENIPELQINETIPELEIYNEHYVWEIDPVYVETGRCIYSDDNGEEIDERFGIDEHFGSYDDEYEDGNMAQAEYDQG